MVQRKKIKVEDTTSGEQTVALYESCNYVWKLTKNSDGIFPLSSPVFPRKNDRTSNYWYLTQHGLYQFGLVLKSCSSEEGVEAEYWMKITMDQKGCPPLVRSATANFKFTVGRESPLLVPFMAFTTARVNLTVEVAVKAFVEERPSGPNFVKFSLDNKKFSDIHLVVGEKVIPAHRIVLATHSPVFAAMFEQDMKENLEGRVEIVDFKPHVVEAMISFLYAGNKPEMTYETTVQLLGIAHKYDIATLEDLCTSYLMESIDERSVADAIVLGYTYGIESLKRCGLNYFCSNAWCFGDHLLDNYINNIKTACPEAINCLIKDLIKVQGTSRP